MTVPHLKMHFLSTIIPLFFSFLTFFHLKNTLFGWIVSFDPQTQIVGSCFDLLHFVKGWQLPCFRFTLSVGVMEEASSCSFFGVEKEWKEGVTECYGGAVISVFPQSPRRQMTGWEWCWKFPTYNVPDLFAYFLPVLISKQLQQTLLPFPVALAVTVFCYDFHAALVCTCFLICLVKLLRGMKMQPEIEAFPFSKKGDCISISACTGKANRKTDTFCVFRGGDGERVNLYCCCSRYFFLLGFL